MKVFILPGGSLICRYEDDLLRMGLKPEMVRRVGEVEWNHEKQEWFAQVSNYRLYATTREMVLDREKVLIDFLLQDVCACWNPSTGTFECPECHCLIVPLENLDCPSCKHHFQNPVSGLRFSDFPFAEMLKSNASQIDKT